MSQPEDPLSDREQLLVLYFSCLKTVDALSSKCTALRDNGRAIACAVYVGAILKDAQAVLVLLKAGCSFSVPKLLRSILESLVNAKAIVVDDSYTDYLVFESAYVTRKNVVRLRELGRTRLYRGRVVAEEESIEFLDNILSAWAGKWECPYTIEKKFQIAKLQYMYDCSYSTMSGNVHALLSTLTTELQNRRELPPFVSLNNEVDTETLASWIEIATLSMVESVECLYQACDIKPDAELQNIKWNIIQLQRKYFSTHCPEHYKEYPE
jgi:hypothetical protein